MQTKLKHNKKIYFGIQFFKDDLIIKIKCEKLNSSHEYIIL